MSAADMEGNFFLDTNILIYAVDEAVAPQKQQIAEQLAGHFEWSGDD